MPLYDSSDFKTTNGITRTRSLFWELDYDGEDALFTIKDEECVHPRSNRTLVPIGKLFIELTVEDPTEYSFAEAVFGSWDAWDKISSGDKRIQANVERWRREADVRRKSLAFATLLQEAKKDGKSSFTAAKYLLEDGWKKPDGRTTDGRKERAQTRETAEEAFRRSALEEDIQRLKEEGHLQ